jgi:hypothetical protein
LAAFDRRGVERGRGRRVGNLARAYHAAGRGREERAAFAEAFGILHPQLPAQSATYARLLWRSGSLRLEDHDVAAAIPKLQEAVTTAEKIFDAGNARLKLYRETLAGAKARTQHP